LLIADWGLGIGDWGLGIGDWACLKVRFWCGQGSTEYDEYTVCIEYAQNNFLATETLKTLKALNILKSLEKRNGHSRPELIVLIRAGKPRMH
jgi:hypothetical protein